MADPRKHVWTLLLIVSAACGDDPGAGDGGPADGGGLPDTGLPELPFTIALPAAPEDPVPPAELNPPDFGSCPSGFRSVTREGVDTCDPWPETPPECGDDEALFAGEMSCTRVGSACPSSGSFPEGLPAGATIVHVLAGASGGGDGSASSPYGTINEALAVAPSGAIVAIGEGTYAERLDVTTDLTLWGACTGATILAPPVGPFEAPISIRGRTVVVRDMRISGGGHRGIGVTAGGVADVRGVIVEGTARTGIGVYQGSELTAIDVVVRDTESSEADGRFGNGIALEAGSTAELSRVVLERNQNIGIHADGVGTRLMASRLVVRDTRSQDFDRRFGTGINIQNGAIATVSEALVTGNQNGGVVVSGTDALLTLEDVVIRDSLPEEASGAGGGGVYADLDAHVEIRRTLIENCKGAAVGLITGAGATIEDLVVLDTSSQQAGRTAGYGISVSHGGALEVTRALLVRNRFSGLTVVGTGTTATLVDLAVRDTESQEFDEILGSGLSVYLGARVDLTRGSFEGNRFAGIVVFSTGTNLDMSDVTVRGTRGQASDGSSGLGIYVAEGGNATGARLRIEDNRGIGAAATGGARLEMEDVSVADTDFEEASGFYGYGIASELDSHVLLRRALVERCRSLGVVSHGGATLVAEDLQIRDLLADEIGHGGAGLVVGSDGDLRATRVRLERTRHSAFTAVEGGTFALEDVTISDTASTEVGQLVGYGVSVFTGATGSIHRGAIDRGTTIGIIVDGENSSLSIEDTFVRDTRPSENVEALGENGRAVDVQYGGTLDGRRVLLENNLEVSLYAFGAGTTVTLSDVAILDTAARQCAVDTCRDEPLGVGVASIADAIVSLERFSIARAALCGVHISAGGELDLRDGEVSESLVGVCLPEGYDTSRLMDGVTYRDNEANLDSPQLAVPDATEPTIFRP